MADIDSHDVVVFFPDGKCAVKKKAGVVAKQKEDEGYVSVSNECLRTLDFEKLKRGEYHFTDLVVATNDEDEMAERKTETERTERNILRRLTPMSSIRKGKYGSYVYYVASDHQAMKPSFLNLKKFPGGDYMTCDVDAVIAWAKKESTTPSAKLGGGVKGGGGFAKGRRLKQLP